MTSASELFYTRRSRSARPEPGSDFGSSLEPSLFHHNLIRRQSHACAPPLRRSSISSHHSSRSSPHSELSSTRLSQYSSQVQSTTGRDGEVQRSLSRAILIPRERLPGAVLLARARLLERLRGVASPANRQSSRGADRREHIRRERVELPQEKNRKPPGLTERALDSLQLEVFCETNESGDCSICLEGFVEGREVIRLWCGHRFHSDCLVPWVTTCGDCPYCRQVICSFNP